MADNFWGKHDFRPILLQNGPRRVFISRSKLQGKYDIMRIFALLQFLQCFPFSYIYPFLMHLVYIPILNLNFLKREPILSDVCLFIILFDCNRKTNHFIWLIYNFSFIFKILCLIRNMFVGLLLVHLWYFWIWFCIEYSVVATWRNVD